MPLTSSALDRQALSHRYRRNREVSAQVFALIDPAGFAQRPIPLRHPFIFYEGHLPAFSFLTINHRALREPHIDERLERLFERGIDPASEQAAQQLARDDWPSREVVQAFGRACDERVLAALATAQLDNADVPQLAGGQAVFAVLEHEPMHHETLLYIIHQLDPAHKAPITQHHRDGAQPANDLVDVDAGMATLGAARNEIAFGWDNEFERDTRHVPAFAMQRFPVTNGAFLRFVEDGGTPPPFWLERDGEWRLRGVFEELPLPKSWPVYASHDLAQAYAQWAGLRLPSEAQFHRAAYATPAGTERPHPWGDEAPSYRHGNFGMVRFDPEPVDAHPAGASAWGIADLVGNGWEWTSSVFAPFRGFEPMASYPQYSADFFDGKHYVMKGASPVTAVELIRRSFRNWFYAGYPYMYAKFRCVAVR